MENILRVTELFNFETVIETFIEWMLFCSEAETQLIYLKLIQNTLHINVFFYFLKENKIVYFSEIA